MVDVEPLDQLLRQYVNEQGRVNYRDWKRESVLPLTEWLTTIAQLDPTSLAIDEQLAFWINLYNALTIAQILRRYPIASIQPKILGLPNWIAFLRFFTRPVVTVAGQRYSLNGIEHGVLRQLSDPRIHFALVCASIGCPLLRNEAYRSDAVRQQLAMDADRFITNPAKVRYDAEAGVLYCSKIFKWYKQDFLTVAPSIPEYIRLSLPELEINAATPIAFLPYSWHLNQQ